MFLYDCYVCLLCDTCDVVSQVDEITGANEAKLRKTIEEKK